MTVNPAVRAVDALELAVREVLILEDACAVGLRLQPVAVVVAVGVVPEASVMLNAGLWDCR